MDNQDNQYSTYIRRVISLSLLVVTVLINLGYTIFIQRDNLRAGFADTAARFGRYEAALDTSGSIEDDLVRTESIYSVASIMFDRGDHEQASKLFSDLGDYSDSETRYLESEYAAADALFLAGEYDKAIERFSALGNHSDSSDRAIRIKYIKAEDALANGDHVLALSLFMSLGEWNDAEQRAYDTAYAITGDEQAAQEMLASDGLSTEEMRFSVSASEKRNIFNPCSIAAGGKHTVILHRDGTVSALGDNSKGQCNVDSWQNIVGVYAGAMHTVGLKSDGTVVAVGDNSHGQCNVQSWTNIAKLAVNNNSTLALGSDGKIKTCGSNDYSTLTRSADIADIFAGSYAALAITTSNTCLSSHRSFSLVPEGKIVDVQMGTGYSMILYNTGKCTVTVETSEPWEQMVCVSAGPNGMVGADIDGRVRAHFFRDADSVDLSSLSGICQCDAGSEHYVFLSEDGTLHAFGDNSYGQCDLPERI